MKLKQLFTDDSAVSPVIGVILMVAITVILAAVIGTFVLNLGGNLSDTSPQASFGFDFNNTGVTVTHETGDSIESSRLNTTGHGATGTDWGDAYPDAKVGAGDSVEFNGGTDHWSGQTIRVVWSSENGESSATLSKTTAPN